MKKVQIYINNRKIRVDEGKTVLDAAKENKIEIPSLCFHPDLEAKAGCRLCLIEIKGKKGLSTACSVKAEQGMEIITDSSKIERARKINLELIFAQHREECDDCVWYDKCKLLKLAKEYRLKINRFTDRKKNFPCHQFGPSIVFDTSKCMDCRNCVEVCQKQGVNFFDIEEKNSFFEVFPTKDKKRDCIFCGQCLVHCPVGAFESVGEYEDIEKPFKDKSKVIVVQFAPAIRTSIGEEFGMKPGEVVTDKLAAAIRKLGVDKVFDVSVGADFTTMEEAKELMEKIKTGKGVCLSSCCPSWVKFLEFYYPEFIPCIATTRSPHIILGALIKTYWAQKEKIDPKKIKVISIMPCTSKKYEVERDELEIEGMEPVDYVLTTRELARLFKKRNIDLKKIKPEPADNPLGIPSGAGVIYGASGGVAESALRTAYYMITGKNLKNVNLKEVRGMEGVKKAEINIKGFKAKMAVITGTGNAEKILKELKKNPKAYDAVEVMACPGGCIGGGGQPLPSTPEIRRQRAEALYKIDAGKKLRLAHENPIVKKVYKEFLNNEKIIHKICHTKYHKKTREVKI